MVDSHFRKDSLGSTSVENPYALLSYQIRANLECQKRELQKCNSCTNKYSIVEM